MILAGPGVAAAQQIAPNPNPADNTINLLQGGNPPFNAAPFVNFGGLRVGPGVTFTNSDDFINEAGGRYINLGTTSNDALLDNAGLLKNQLGGEIAVNTGGSILNTGTVINNGSVFATMPGVVVQNNGLWQGTGTQTGVFVDQGTLAPGSPGPRPVVNGVVEPADAYGPPLAVQQVGTGFGDNTDAGSLLANGSELDTLRGRIADERLYLTLTGNLETNFNKLEIFFDTQAGGQNTLSGTNPDVDFNGLNRMGTLAGGDGSFGPDGPGLTFDPGFAADYYLTVTGGDTGGQNEFFASAAFTDGSGGSGTFLGQSAPDGNEIVGVDGTRIVIDNSNTAGVVAGTGASSGAGVTTGVEIEIPLAALGLAGTSRSPIGVTAFINGVNHDSVSNQLLGPAPAGTANLGEPRNTDLAALPGDQHAVVPTPTGTTGVYTIDGDWQKTAGSLEIDLRGTGGVPGTDFDRVDVTGDVNLSPGTTLNLGYLEGYSPRIGDNFTIVTGGTIAGGFTDVETPEFENPEGTWETTVSISSIMVAYVGVPGDMDFDSHHSNADIQAFVLALQDPMTYEEIYSYAPVVNGDMNADGVFNLSDIEPFVALVGPKLGLGATLIIPEPSSVLWCALGAGLTLVSKRRQR